jgi:hypothetical protein
VLRGEGSYWRDGSILHSLFPVKSIFELFFAALTGVSPFYAVFSPVLPDRFPVKFFYCFTLRRFNVSVSSRKLR